MYLGRWVILGAICFCWTASAHASNYALDVVKGALQIDDRSLAGLQAQGVSTTEQLYARGSAKGRALGKAAGVPAAKLSSWVASCDLMRVRGIGPRMARVLATVGVTSTRKLANQTAASLSARIEKANSTGALTANTPSELHLSAWIAKARKLNAGN